MCEEREWRVERRWWMESKRKGSVVVGWVGLESSQVLWLSGGVGKSALAMPRPRLGAFCNHLGHARTARLFPRQKTALQLIHHHDAICNAASDYDHLRTYKPIRRHARPHATDIHYFTTPLKPSFQTYLSSSFHRPGSLAVGDRLQEQMRLKSLMYLKHVAVVVGVGKFEVPHVLCTCQGVFILLHKPPTHALHDAGTPVARHL